MEKQNIYQDISARTGGEIYLGVVGPVRSGKSTFIKRFMELLVLPAIKDENERKRTMDELPQSGTGKIVMTTEPKFIPKEAAELPMEDMKIKIRLIDCVGFMIPGAGGNLENGQERLVKTPWFDYEVPFTKAAEYGTRKVIRDHSTIGILVTADGSFGEIPRDSYVEAEKKVDLGSSDYTTVAATILEGVVGASNVTSIDNCITRLRLEVKDSSLVDEKKIKSAGAAGVIRPSKTAVQVVIGTKVQFVADEFKKLCR